MANEQEEKTEEATPKRKEKERERGHISKSRDFTSALVLTIGLGGDFANGNSKLEKIKTILFTTFTFLNPKQISDDDFVVIMTPYCRDFISIMALFLALLAMGGNSCYQNADRLSFCKRSFKT